MDRITKPQARTGPTKLAFHASRIIIDVGVLIAMAAMSMPFVTTQGADKNSVAADALPVIILLAPIFLVTLLPDHSKPIPVALGWGSLVLGIAAFPYAVVKYLDAANLATTLDGAVGFGARLLVFGTFVTLSGIGVGLARNMLILPSGGTYPARPARQPSPALRPRRRPQSGAPRPSGSAPAPEPHRAVPPNQPRRERPIDPGRSSGPGER